jgi:serine/threonine-protein kinase
VYAAGASDDFAGVSTLRVRALDALEPMVISNLGRTPFFSPDGEWIGYSTDNGIERVARAGGPALPISSAGSGIRGASWNVDDTIVFATSDPSSGLFRIPAAGAETETLTTPDATRGELDHLFPRFLPDGRHLLFTITTAEGIANAQIAVLDLESRDYRVLIRGGSDAHYASSGHIVYGSLGNLLAVPFDLARLEVLGSPEPVVQGVATKATGAASFAVSDGGTLVYIPGGAVQSVQRTLVWVDRKGSEEPIPVPLRNYHYAQLSPDGQRIALDVRDQENDVWIWDLERQSLQRLTFDPGFNRGPVWSPDGSRVAFSRALDGREEVYWQPWDGSGLPEPLTAGSPAAMLPTDISTDGKTLFFMQASRPRDVLMISIGEEVSAGTPILAGPASEEGAMLSPDGRWLAYQSNESGEWQIYVRPFPDLERGRWQVSTNEGTRPRWSRSGRELFYYFTTGRTGGLMAVTVTTDPGFRAGTPRRLFEGDYQAPNQGRHVYDVSLDDQRFLMIKGLETVDDEEAPQIVVVENWFEELERLVPTE